MAHEGPHNLAKTRVRRAGELAQHRFRNVRFIPNNHLALRIHLLACRRWYLVESMAVQRASRQERLGRTPAYIRPSSRSSRRIFSGMAAAPGAAFAKSRGASFATR